MLNKTSRPGLTLMEATAAVAVFGVLAVIVAQCMVLSLRERTRTQARQVALELANNLLEAARAQPWEALDQSWADKRSVPAGMDALLPEGRIDMKIEPSAPNLRRVTVNVSWQFEASAPPPEVRLVTLLAARQARQAEGKP